MLIMAKKPGRPSKLTPAAREKSVELAAQGKTNEQIADILGVHRRTIENWSTRDQEFLWALKEAKSHADDAVEASLFMRAVGYKHAALKFFKGEKRTTDPVTDETKVEDVVIEHPYTKHYPPDTTAAIFWLKNRRPDQWREKDESAKDPLANKTAAEIEARIQELLGNREKKDAA